MKTHAVWHATLLAVLEQKVAGKEALAAYVGICRAWSEPSPGPRPMLLPPAAEVIAELPYFELSRFGVERRRSETLRRLAARARELEALGLRDARAYLERFPGVGPWTSAEIARVALGDADALSVGDYNLPHLVAVNLTGEPRGDDAQMLALLAPYAGHRGRAQRLLEVGGRPAPLHLLPDAFDGPYDRLDVTCLGDARCAPIIDGERYTGFVRMSLRAATPLRVAVP